MPYAVTNRPGADRRAGFTLIEILGVIVILGIASAVIVPQISTRDDLKAAAMARVIMADLAYAQDRSIAMQKVHYVRFDVAAGTYDVLDSMSPVTRITHPVDKGPYLVQVGAGRNDSLKVVTINSADFDGQPVIAFDELGVPYSYNAATAARTPLNAGTITLKSGAFTLSVTVSPFSGELQAL